MEDELEERLRRRDRRFLWRIGIAVGLSAIFGALLWSWLAGTSVGSCVATGFGTVTGG